MTVRLDTYRLTGAKAEFRFSSPSYCAALGAVWLLRDLGTFGFECLSDAKPECAPGRWDDQADVFAAANVSGFAELVNWVSDNRTIVGLVLDSMRRISGECEAHDLVSRARHCATIIRKGDAA